jgi:N-acetylglucosaminyldiphosphoundecaprenol N-acetyl-beta-D-mannosaminyltransferase
MPAEILSVRIDPLNFTEVMEIIGDFLEDERLHQIATVNPEFVMAAQHDEEFLRILNGCDLNIADGIGLQIGAQILGTEIGERITGVDLSWALAGQAAERGHSVFLLGSGEGVAAIAASRMKEKYPGLKIAGTYAGTPDEPGLVERINDSGAMVLLVAFGAPKQEKFIFHNRERLVPKVAMGIGGTLDYIAGVIPRAPGWMRKAGMEWLYRLVKQPSRINRIITATVRFPVAVLLFKLFGKPAKRNGSGADLDRANDR